MNEGNFARNTSRQQTKKTLYLLILQNTFNSDLTLRYLRTFLKRVLKSQRLRGKRTAKLWESRISQFEHGIIIILLILIMP